MKKSTHAPKYNAQLIGTISGLRKPTPEFRFHPMRKWRFDFAWQEAGIALEIEGGGWVNGGHNRGSGRAKDREKFNHAAELGWLIFYVTPKEVYSHTILRMIRNAYEARLAESAKARKPKAAEVVQMEITKEAA